MTAVTKGSKVVTDELNVEMQPAPFPATMIRHAAFEGKQMLYHIEARGETPYLRLTTYLEVYDTHVVFEFENLDAEGNLIDEAVEGTATWEELEGHATYPKSMTTVSQMPLDVVAGSFDCWLYEVKIVSEDGPGMIRAYFAKERPGPPIRFEQSVDGELTYLMELVDGHGPSWESREEEE